MRSAQRLPHASSTRLGSALLPALVAVATVGSLSAIALKTSVATLNEERAAAARKQAFYVAEAGLAEAFASLATGGGGNIGSQDKPAKIGGGYVFVEALEDEWGHFKLTSFGLVEDARVRLGAVVEPEEIHLGELGFFAVRDLIIGEGSQLLEAGEEQGVDLAELPTAPPPLKVQANGSIEIQGTLSSAGTIIQGDIVPGPEASLAIGSGVQISGSTTPISVELEIPAISPPDVSPYGDVSITPGLSTSFGGRDAAADSVTLGSNSILTLVGPTKIVTECLTLGEGSTLIADGTNGPVELFVGEQLEIATGASLTNLTGKAGDFSLALTSSLAKSEKHEERLAEKAAKDLLKGKKKSKAAEELEPDGFTIRSATPFAASIVAPKAAVTLEAGTEFTGSIVAYSLCLEPGTEAYFDQRLGETGPLLGGGIKLKSWRILSVPTELSAAEYDPAGDYQAASEVARSLAEAHQPARMMAVVEGEDGETYNTFVEDLSNLPPGIKKVLTTKYPSDLELLKEYSTATDSFGQLIKLARVKAVADNVLTSDESDWSGE